METRINAKRSKSAVGVKPRGLSKKAKKELRNRKKTACAVCDSKISYLNPIGCCSECKKRFCFDHLWGGLFKDGMSQNESLRDVCDECKEKYGYKELRELNLNL